VFDSCYYYTLNHILFVKFFLPLNLDRIRKNITVGFISAEAEGLGQMLFWGDEFIKKIKPDLEKEFKLS